MFVKQIKVYIFVNTQFQYSVCKLNLYYLLLYDINKKYHYKNLAIPFNDGMVKKESDSKNRTEYTMLSSQFDELKREVTIK